MISKEVCIQKYCEYKKEFGKAPSAIDFFKYTKLPKLQLVRLFGKDAYSKLQIESGDKANKIDMVRTPVEKIMRQYGDLVLEIGSLPSSADWTYKGNQPEVRSLYKTPHFIKWSEFPIRFKDWIDKESIDGYDKAIKILEGLNTPTNSKKEKSDRDFDKLIIDTRLWSPARRRNNEEGYKVELRGHLKSLGYEVKEEFGESNFDLLIGAKFVIEIKKDPNQSEYDRLFGQLARHLQHQIHVIALILDAPSEDKFHNFSVIVDQYLNKDKKFIEVIKK